jgi:hypothetical protein
VVDIAQVKCVGFSILGMVGALKRQYKGVPPNLPDSVKGYFERELGPTDLYPLADYATLLDLLMQVTAPKGSQRFEACAGLGAFAGKRDAGVPPGPGEPPRQAHPHFRVSFERVLGLPVVVRRTLSMREKYYNRGYYKVKRTKSHEIEISLHEFPGHPDLCAVSTGYLRELFVAANVGAALRLSTCRGMGDSACTWLVSFRPDIDTSSLVVFQ